MTRLKDHSLYSLLYFYAHYSIFKYLPKAKGKLFILNYPF